MSDEHTFTLSRSLKTHSGDLTTLTLQEPTARAFIENGDPFKMRTGKNSQGEPTLDFDYDNRVMVKVLSEMIVEKVDDLILGDLRASDFLALRAKATELILRLTGPNPT